MKADAYNIKENITKSDMGVYRHRGKIKGMVYGLQKDMITAVAKTCLLWQKNIKIKVVLQ